MSSLIVNLPLSHYEGVSFFDFSLCENCNCNFTSASNSNNKLLNSGSCILDKTNCRIAMKGFHDSSVRRCQVVLMGIIVLVTDEKKKNIFQRDEKNIFIQNSARLHLK